MNNSVYRITLDVLRADAQVQLTARAGDTGRTLRATLTERGKPYDMGANCRAQFVAQLPDGQVLKNPCTVEDGVVVYTFTHMTTAQAGVLECELRLLGPSGELLVSPRFSLVIYGTVYSDGDAALQEGISLSTVKSSRPGYSQVFSWADGNRNQEVRLSRFVSSDVSTNAAMVRLADGTGEILGVTAAEPGFAAMAGQEKYDARGKLVAAHCYVTMLGFAAVEDLGRCTVNGRCTSDSKGLAVPCDKDGYLVTERIDESRVMVLLVPRSDNAGAMEELTANLEKRMLANVPGAVSSENLAPGAVTAGKLAAGAVTAQKLESGAVTAEKLSQNALLRIYPVGSVYLSVLETSPAELFGGTWERLENRFLLGAGSGYGAGSTGGEAAHTLTAEEMPSHNHIDHKSARLAVWDSDAGITNVAKGSYGDSLLQFLSYGIGLNVAGGDQPHNNMPPYLAVYMWKRIA